MRGDTKKNEKAPLERSTSTASTVPGDDTKAQQMAAENNAQRLKEIKQYQDQRRHGRAMPAPQGSTDTLILGGSEAENSRKLRRVGSSPLLQPKPAASKTVKPAPTETTKTKATKPTKPTASQKGKKMSHKKVTKKTKKTAAAAKKAKRAQIKKKQAAKSNGIAGKPTPPAAPPGAEQQVHASKEVEKTLPAAQPSSQGPVPQVPAPPPVAVKIEPPPIPAPPAHPAGQSQAAPVATPARAPGQPPMGDAVRDLLNRAATQEQLQTPPGTPALASGIPGTTQPPESEPKKQRKPRDKARHARKQKFYRSLDSRSPSQPKDQGIFYLCVHVTKNVCQIVLQIFPPLLRIRILTA